MRNLKGVFHEGYCNVYFPFQVVAASMKAERCLPLHIIANKISAIPNQKRPHTDTLNISLGATYAAWASDHKHLHSNIRKPVTAAQGTVEQALKRSPGPRLENSPGCRSSHLRFRSRPLTLFRLKKH